MQTCKKDYINTVKDIGKRVYTERNKNNFTQEMLAQKIGISRQTLSKLEQGESIKIDFFTILNLCEVFRCEIGYLLCEYDCKRKDIANIQNKIGISEQAIMELERINSNENIHAVMYNFDKIISLLIESPLFTELLINISTSASKQTMNEKKDNYLENKKGIDILEADKLLLALGKVSLSVEEFKELYFQKAVEVFTRIIREIQEKIQQEDT